jgi:putative addiction module component (TIGR02574 family)
MTRMNNTEHSVQVETAEEQLAELESRLAELDEHPEAGESWDTVRARILDSL